MLNILESKYVQDYSSSVFRIEATGVVDGQTYVALREVNKYTGAATPEMQIRLFTEVASEFLLFDTLPPVENQDEADTTDDESKPETVA